ncbi:hypothetical protein AKJ51_03285, partial [candidate division MSBL1 archaeon SCGC-AAA382A20]
GRYWFRGNEEVFQKCKDWFKNYLEITARYARDKGVTLAVETGSHSADYPGHPKELVRAVEKVKDVGITLDVGHLYLSAPEKEEAREDWIFEQIELVKDFLVSVHLHDNYGLSDDHLPPGRGKINFFPIMEALGKYYDGPIILELWDLSNPVKDVKKSIETIKEVL